MLILTIINFFIILCIFGYAYIFKNLFFGKKNSDISNLDFLYGLIFLYFLSLIFHAFFPLKQISIIIILLGLLASFLSIFKKELKVSLFKYFFIVFAFSVIAYYGVNNIDSPLYHLQVVKWITDHKLSFGLSNLAVRLGVNYPWYSIIGVLNFEYNLFSNKYYLSLIIFSFIFYEIVTQKKSNQGLIFLSLSFCYLLLFSLIHPFNYGVILNHFGNPEKDIFNMLIFFLTIYLFLKINENKKDKNFKYTNSNLINIFLISIALLIMQVPIYVFIIFLFFYIFYKFIELKNFNFIFIFLILLGTLWILKSISLSGCLIFPLSFTCLETDWTIDQSTIKFFVDETKRYCRSLPGLEFINNYHITLETFKWVIPWFKNYYLTTAMHQINSVILTISFIIVIYLLTIKKFIISNSNKILFFSVFLINLTCLIIIPEIRYYWGPHISISCLLITFLINALNIELFKNKNFLIFPPVILLLLFIIFKVLPNSEYLDLLNLPERHHDYSEKIRIGSFNGYNVYSNGWKCADIKEICVNIPKKKYNFMKINSYLFINR